LTHNHPFTLLAWQSQFNTFLMIMSLGYVLITPLGLIILVN
jgi:hypothetical protein